MSYSRSRKITNTEKKLQTLKAQLYGKEKVAPSSSTFKLNLAPTVNQKSVSLDQPYLKRDLFKTLILAGLIITVQFFIFIATNKGLFNLSW